MRALIDADTPIFGSAVSCEGEEEWKATSRLDTTIEKIIDGCGCSSYTLFVSGEGNFRYDIDPLYKSHRGPSPEHREACRKHLVKYWKAVECHGYEADDAVGCEQNDDTFIVGIDKDLLMIPGKHYRWPIIRGGKEVRAEQWHDISEEDGIRTFFEQSLIGDKADNIIGIDGIGPVKAKKALEHCTTEEEMYTVCKDMYMDDERYTKNLDLLWIWRSYGYTYSILRECK
jgi:5'-3' exonuclease